VVDKADSVSVKMIGSVIDSSYREEGSLGAIIGFLILIVVLRWGPRVADSVVQAFSGEQRSLMPRGFLRYSTRIRRTIELQVVVSRLAMITRMNLPLCRALEAAATGESGRVKHMLDGLAQRIGEGSPVSSALESVLPGCPTQLIATLRRAESCGQLAQALDQQDRMIASLVDLHFRSTAHTRHAVLYALIMMVFCAVMVFGIVIFLIPKFKDIFLDFDVSLPAVTMTLLNLVDWFAVNAFGIVLVLTLICFVVILTVVMTRRVGNVSTGSRIIAMLRFHLPITRSLDYGLGMAKAIRAMAFGIRSGAPNVFVETSSPVVSITNHLRTRLDAFSNSIAKGVAPHVAAQNAELGDVFVCALRMVERGEDPERVLSHAADYYETIAYRWWHALAAISGPLVTVGMGVMVGFVALALFMPLIALIDSVSGSF
jgi:type IV pilus assembly protein PilC